MRINKYLSETGCCSRREADRLVKAGKVTINGKRAVLGDAVQVADSVKVAGKIVRPQKEKVYILFHKPVGVITTTDKRSHNNIMQALARSKKVLPKTRIFPVGRLDVASSGLILLTNDNDLANKMLPPEGCHEKEYEVRVDRDVTSEFLRKMAAGVLILGKKTLPAKVEKLSPRSFSITITEGKHRQIRRMCTALGYKAIVLSRTRLMHIKTGKLLAGEWRYLTDNEVMRLRRDVLK